MSIEIKNPAEAYAKLKRVQELANLLLIEIKEQVMAETDNCRAAKERLFIRSLPGLE